jgi:hypothetical protein
MVLKVYSKSKYEVCVSSPTIKLEGVIVRFVTRKHGCSYPKSKIFL